jgi:hypothetical protein
MELLLHQHWLSTAWEGSVHLASRVLENLHCHHVRAVGGGRYPLTLKYALMAYQREVLECKNMYQLSMSAVDVEVELRRASK